jgi:hypothetical protein
MTWGVESHTIERFAQAGVAKENISVVKGHKLLCVTQQKPNTVHRFI